MKRMFDFARTATIAATLVAVPAFAQNNGAAGSRSGSDMGHSSAGSQDMSRTSPIEVTDHDRDFDLGWMGLLGLAGLAGLRRKRTVVHDHTHDRTMHSHTDVHPNRTDRM